MLNGNGGCRWQQLADGLTAQVSCHGLRVGSQLVLFHIHRTNWVNSCNDSWRWQHHKQCLRINSSINKKYSFLITWRSSSSKSTALYKISSKSDDFSLRYGDISIFKMAVIRHLGIVLPPYKTTHEVSVAGRSCLSNFMSIWYTDLKL